MERLHGGGEKEHGHRTSGYFDGDVFLSLWYDGGSSSSSSSSSGSGGEAAGSTATTPPRNSNNKSCRRPRRRRRDEAFECRTCGRQFATFQALGGHRTSHLRRPAAAATTHRRRSKGAPVAVVHACGKCGLVFSTGQALGGHMRRHRRRRAMMGSCDAGFTQINVRERASSASVQLLDLFV